MIVLGHVGGVPVEETLLMLGPAIVTAGGMMIARVRYGLRRPRRAPRPRRARPAAPTR